MTLTGANCLNVYLGERIANPDRLEKVGKTLSHFLTAIAGRKYTIHNGTFSEQPAISKVKRVVLAIIFAVLAPISAAISVLGILFTHLSKSHRSCVQAHKAFAKTQTPEAIELEQLRKISTLAKKTVTCVDCHEISKNPRLLNCGHTICYPCYESISSQTQRVTYCPQPLCKKKITYLIPSNLCDLATKIIELKDPNATSPVITQTDEELHISGLMLGCHAQSEIAKSSVKAVLKAVSPQDWVNGVYISFESAVSRIFFATFALTLHGKNVGYPDGLNVLVNSAQRILAVQVGQNTIASQGNLLIKVMVDGRLTIGTTPSVPAQNQVVSVPVSTPTPVAALPTVPPVPAVKQVVSVPASAPTPVAALPTAAPVPATNQVVPSAPTSAC